MHLNLQLNLERLGPAYHGSETYFSLLVSAALQPHAGEVITDGHVRDFLQLWQWKISELEVVAAPSDLSQPWKTLKHRRVPAAPPPTGIDALKQRLHDELESQLTLQGFAAADFEWTAFGKPVQPEEKTWQSDPTARHGRDWRAFLSHLSTYPGGIGIHLNLTVFFHVEGAIPNDVTVLAAPVFAMPGHATAFEPIDANTAGAITPNNNDKTVFEWNYAVQPQLSVHAYATAPKPLAANPNGFINLETLWRNVPEGLAIGPAYNWLPALSDQVSTAMELTRPLLDELRSIGAGDVPADFGTRLRRAVFSVVRPAIEPSPDELRRTPIGAEHIQKAILYRHCVPADFKFSEEMPDQWLPLPAAGKSAEAYAGVIDQFLIDVEKNAGMEALVLGLWKSAYAGAKPWEEVEGPLKKAIAAIPRLHAFLARHNARLVWRGLFATPLPRGEELSEIRERLKTAVVSYAADTLVGVSEPLEGLIGRSVERALEDDRQPANDPTSDGINVQIDRVDGPGVDKDGDRDDLLRQISGAGVLLRRRGAKEWRCLNMSDITVYDAWLDRTKPLVGRPLDAARAYAVPVRPQYSNELRQSFIPYQNQPLVATSPWAKLAPNRTISSTTFDVNALVGYESSAYRNGWKLERLMYGERYEAAVFYFANSGAVPAECAAESGTADARPWEFVLPTKVADTQIINHHFLRRCPVGPLRTQPIQRALAFPERIPDRVFPLATELVAKAAAAKQPAISATPDGIAEPIVLLRPAGGEEIWDLNAKSTTTFVLRPPTLDAKVWERWQPDIVEETDEREKRKLILSDHFSLLNAHLRQQRLDEDDTLDDGAVDGFTVHFERMHPPTGVATPVSALFDFGSPRRPEGIGSQQRAGRKIVVASTASAKPSAALDADGTLRIAVPNHEVWRVEFVPDASELSRQRLTTAAAKSLDISTDIIVEVAAPLFTKANKAESAKALHDALGFEYVAADPPATNAVPKDHHEEQLRIRLLAAPLGAAAPIAHRAETLLQRWRWDGRPVYEVADQSSQSGLPFTKLGDMPDDPAIASDEMLFADRHDGDAVIMTGIVDLTSSAANAVLQEVKLTSKTGVIYHRAGVRLFSRYEGLLRGEHHLDSGLDAAATRRRWRRHVVPLRWRERVPRPIVKVILPLTETLGEHSGPKVPGWMIYLDEPWYSENMGGLGEYLDSRIDEITLPDDAAQTRHQFGPDPIVSMAEDAYAEARPKLPRPIGAIGYTFDTGSSAPLFTRSSFFQPPPEVQTSLDLAFHFAKVRFRRVLVGADPTDPRKESSASAWTDPYWVQVLPPADQWRIVSNDSTEPSIVDIGELSLSKNNRVQWRGQEVTVLPTQTESAIGRFEIYAWVTRTVSDAFGRANQEAFHAILPLAQLSEITGVPPAEIRLRLVEVHLRMSKDAPLPGDAAALIDCLFKGYQGLNLSADADGRVVRVSRPLRRQ